MVPHEILFPLVKRPGDVDRALSVDVPNHLRQVAVNSFNFRNFAVLYAPNQCQCRQIAATSVVHQN
jgi:hypothetical protein